jgi:hypothetical protein
MFPSFDPIDSREGHVAILPPCLRLPTRKACMPSWKTSTLTGRTAIMPLNYETPELPISGSPRAILIAERTGLAAE